MKPRSSDGVSSLGRSGKAIAAEPKRAIVLGTEGHGLAHSTIAACDYTVKIPMSHGVDSLNVAAERCFLALPKILDKFPEQSYTYRVITWAYSSVGSPCGP